MADVNNGLEFESTFPILQMVAADFLYFFDLRFRFSFSYNILIFKNPNPTSIRTLNQINSNSESNQFEL
jgi:hypothetical protein